MCTLHRSSNTSFWTLFGKWREKDWWWVDMWCVCGDWIHVRSRRLLMRSVLRYLKLGKSRVLGGGYYLLSRLLKSSGPLQRSLGYFCVNLCYRTFRRLEPTRSKCDCFICVKILMLPFNSKKNTVDVNILTTPTNCLKFTSVYLFFSEKNTVGVWGICNRLYYFEKDV